MKDPEEIKPDENLKADKANHLEEWKQARGILKFFDDKSYDLRKYGFTFITALLTAEGILLSKESDLDTPIRFAVYSVTLLLILALHLIDNNFRVYKRAANTRALVLEKKLNLELSETITDRYKEERIDWKIILLYCIFISGVSFLGLFSLWDERLYFYIFIVLIVIALSKTVFSFRHDIVYKYGHRENWTVSPLECTLKSKVFITLTNFNPMLERKKLDKQASGNQVTWKGILFYITRLIEKLVKLPEDIMNLVMYLKNNMILLFKGGKEKKGKDIKIRKPIHFKKGETIFEIINETSGEPCYEKKAARNLDIYDNQTWIINGGIFKENGVYQILPRKWPLPLNRRIIVTDRIP